MGHVVLDCCYCCVKFVIISIKIIRLVDESTSPATIFLSTKSYFLVQRQLFRGLLFHKKILAHLIGGSSQWSCPKKFREKKMRLQFNNFTQKLDIDVLWFRRRRANKN